jgi:chromosome segregation ATPase
MGLGIVPSNPDSATKAFADLKAELDKEKAAQKVAQIEVDTLARAVKDLKILADKFAAQIPTFEDKVKHLEDKVVDGLNEVRAWELCLERTTQANEDYKKQNVQLTKKLESKSLGRVRTFYQSWAIF